MDVGAPEIEVHGWFCVSESLSASKEQCWSVHECVCMCVCMHKHAHVESMGVSCLPDDSLPYVVSQVFVVGLA